MPPPEPPTEREDRLDDLLAERARRAPDAPALEDVAPARTLSWRDWESETDRCADLLRDAGAEPGMRIALVLHRSPSFLVWLLACGRAGAVAVPLDPGCTSTELAGFLAHADCALAVMDGSISTFPDLPVAPSTRAPVDAPPHRVVRLAASGEPSPPGDALVLYTSGSTGAPRGVRLTHRGIVSSVLALARQCRLGPETRVLGTLPLHSSHGLFTHGLGTLGHGGTLVLAPLPGPFQARTFWAEAARAGATFFSTVPAVLSLLLSMAEGMPPVGLRIYSASAPLAPDLQEAFRARFGICVRNSFGMSETAGWFLYGEEHAPPGATGRPAGCEVRLRAKDASGAGEMLLRGAQVTPGYWRDPVATQAAFDGDWLRTGDMARMDLEGRIHCVGRTKRVIQRAGQSVFPEDIEAVLASAPQVQEAVVVGVAHPVYGEVPRAFVVARPGETLEVAALHRLLKEKLSAFRLPRWLDVVESLPRLRSGKPDLRRLAERPLPDDRPR